MMITTVTMTAMTITETKTITMKKIETTKLRSSTGRGLKE
jgi:hypothetical protein